MDYNEYLRYFLTFLEESGFYQVPLTPGQLKKMRKQSSSKDLRDLFSLGKGLSANHIKELGLDLKFLTFREGLFYSPLAFSSLPTGELIPHSHWPPEKDDEYTHLGPESFYLYRQMEEKFPKRVLDLGSGTGVLGFSLPSTTIYQGIDCSKGAIKISSYLKNHFDKYNFNFTEGFVGSKEINNHFEHQSFDLIVSNPPLAIPGETVMRHRDGGKLGIEIPLLFLDFALNHLTPDGEYWFIAGEVVASGKKLIYEELKKREVVILEETILEEFFNHAYAEKHHYNEQNIDQVNLTLYKVKK